MDLKKTGGLIAAIRKEKGWTQEQPRRRKAENVLQ